MLYAAMLGGIVISHARTGAAHTLTRPIGDKVPHGLANAIVLPHVMAYNLPADPPKFADVARALDRPADPQEAVEVVRELIATLELPTRLRDAGIDEADLAPLADAAYELEISGLNPRELGREDIERLLREAY
jgi:alcohol dehydrogenase class IV